MSKQIRVWSSFFQKGLVCCIFCSMVRFLGVPVDPENELAKEVSGD